MAAIAEELSGADRIKRLLDKTPQRLDTILGPTEGQSAVSEVIRNQPGVSTNAAEAMRLKRLLTTSANTRDAKRFKGELRSIRKREADKVIEDRAIRKLDRETKAKKEIAAVSPTIRTEGKKTLQEAKFAFKDAQRQAEVADDIQILGVEQSNKLEQMTRGLSDDLKVEAFKSASKAELQKQDNDAKAEAADLAGDRGLAERLRIEGQRGVLKAQQSILDARLKAIQETGDTGRLGTITPEDAGITTPEASASPAAPTTVDTTPGVVTQVERDRFNALERILKSGKDIPADKKLIIAAEHAKLKKAILESE